jgi:N utilization substance protein B
MISRRNIRVKVMQTLYSLASMNESKGNSDAADIKQGNGLLNEKLSRSLDVFTVSILYTLEVARYAEKDAHLRASKYLPSEADLGVSTKISGNEFLWQVLSNETFTEKIKEAKLDALVDAEWIKKLYVQLTQTEEYKSYISVQERHPKTEKAIVQYIWQELILKNESLQEHFTDELPGYEDDKEMVVMLMENFFRSHKGINFLSLISAEKREYAHDLLKAVLQREDFTMELIKPRLVNWESDRIPVVDLLLLQMGVCEFLYFPTIPTKVTINEYIEVAKIYSTPQSGQFINGVLDNILKTLEKEGKIRKQERTPKK